MINSSFNAARGFVGGADDQSHSVLRHVHRFNAARGFVGGAALGRIFKMAHFLVSMPHAALWVVQQVADLS